MGRDFHHKPAVREQAPVLIGLTGPSGSGKTPSALRLATGMVRVRGGKVVGIDTETNRMLHYAPLPGEKPDIAKMTFAFEHIQFTPPFSSLDYLEVITEAAKIAEGGAVIIDSMSHEHEGAGGYLEYHDEEVRRLLKVGFKNEMAASIPAWNRPAARRRKLINGILQINAAFIFCFRAKEKLKIVSGKDPIPLGWQAIGGEEFVYEMLARCLLPPGSRGKPDWSAAAFDHGAAKLEEQHRALFEGGQLNEEMGERIARWASGTPSKPKEPVKAISAEQVAELKKKQATSTVEIGKFLGLAGANTFEAITTDKYDGALAYLEKRQK